MAHICLFARGGQPSLFCGDTLFNAGAGNCHNGGHPQQLYETFVTQLALLPEETRVFAGHEYLARNLEFTLDREPDNAAARSLLDTAREQAPVSMKITTLVRRSESTRSSACRVRRLSRGCGRPFPTSASSPMRAPYS